MPGLNPSPIETALTIPVRRRVWAHPEIISHSLLVLTLDQFYLASLAGDPKPETLAAVEAGTDLDVIFGPLAVVINLSTVRRLTLDLLTNSLVIEYSGAGTRASQQRLTFANPEAADACFTRIWRRLGSRFRLSPYRKDAWNLIRGPLLLLLGALAATAVAVLLLNVLQDMDAGPGKPASTSGARFGWFGWRFVCGIGGVVAAVSQVWLYRKLTTPPVSLELIRS